MPRRDAQPAAGVRVHLSEDSMEVGRKRSRMSRARQGVTIMRLGEGDKIVSIGLMPEAERVEE